MKINVILALTNYAIILRGLMRVCGEL